MFDSYNGGIDLTAEQTKYKPCIFNHLCEKIGLES